MLGTQTKEKPCQLCTEHCWKNKLKKNQKTPKKQVKERAHSSEDAFIHGRAG